MRKLRPATTAPSTTPGVLLQERSDLAEAETWWRQAADAGHHGAE